MDITASHTIWAKLHPAEALPPHLQEFAKLDLATICTEDAAILS